MTTTTDISKDLREAIEHLVDSATRSPGALFYESGIKDAWEDVDELLAEIPLIEAARDDAEMARGQVDGPDELRRLAKFWRDKAETLEDIHNARWC